MASQDFELCLPKLWNNEIISNNDSEIIIRSSTTDIEDINRWVKMFGENTNTKWNTRSTRPSGKRILASKIFVCHHSSFNKKTHRSMEKRDSKNTNCSAKINAQIKLLTDVTKKRDPFVANGMLGVIRIDKIHNHNLNTCETLRFLPADTNNDIHEKFIEYFNTGMGIAEACRYHEQLLELGEGFKEQDLANSRINPTKRAVRWWHDKWRLANLGPRTGVGMIEKLKEKQETYMKNGIKILFSEEPFVVAVITPIMMRAHHLESSEDMVFVDSTSACDAENHSITFMLTPCAAGAVPLAMFISKGQTEEMYQTGFKLVKECIPEAFNGKSCPKIFITDHSKAEINAIKSVFPTSRNFLCIFHICQAVWRWLWDSKHNIPKHLRPDLMELFQNILYATSTEKAEEAYRKSLTADLAHWNAYVDSYWAIRELWCLAYRNEVFKGHHTNNFSETAIRIFKDVVLSRMKAYNVTALIDIACVVLEQYYCHRLREFANNRNSNARLFLASISKRAAYISEKDIIKIKDNEYLVPSEQNRDQLYSVNVLIGVCECPEGMFGKFCKHQYAIFKFCDATLQNLPPVTPLDRFKIAKLALGDSAPPLQFYYPLELEDTETVENTENVVDTENSMPFAMDTGCYSMDAAALNEPTNTNVKEETNASLEMIIDILKENYDKFGSSTSGLNVFHKRLSKISSQGQWETFLHTAGREIPLRKRAGVAIRAQPSSIARRAPGVTRGSKRLPSGRPAKGEKIVKKRKRNLMANIKLNQPNAKSHGIGH